MLFNKSLCSYRAAQRFGTFPHHSKESPHLHLQSFSIHPQPRQPACLHRLFTLIGIWSLPCCCVSNSCSLLLSRTRPLCLGHMLLPTLETMGVSALGLCGMTVPDVCEPVSVWTLMPNFSLKVPRGGIPGPHSNSMVSLLKLCLPAAQRLRHSSSLSAVSGAFLPSLGLPLSPSEDSRHSGCEEK